MLNCSLKLFIILLHLADGAVSEIDKSPLWYTNGKIKYLILMKDMFWE